MKAILAPSFRYSARFNSRGVPTSIWRGLIIAAVVLFLLVALFSTEKARLQCSGKMSTKYGPSPATVYADLKRQRWALRSLSASKGYFQLEIPQEAVHHYAILQDNGDILDIALGDEKQLGGTYSTSGNQLALRTPQGSFVGTCRVVD
jgi:hypothetical protein